MILYLVSRKKEKLKEEEVHQKKVDKKVKHSVTREMVDIIIVSK
jgi:hypothetical protein